MGKVGAKVAGQVAVKPVDAYPPYTTSLPGMKILSKFFAQPAPPTRAVMRVLYSCLYTPKTADITDEKFRSSPLSTIPITTTTTYI